MRFRWLNKFYAQLNGYFWLPCPLCKQYMGGHEWNGQGIPKNDDPKCTTIQGICKDCIKAGKARPLPMFDKRINND